MLHQFVEGFFMSGLVFIYLFILNVFQRRLEKKKRIILLNSGKEQWSWCLPAVLEEMKCHSQQNSLCLHRYFEKFCATWDKSNIKAAWSSWSQGVSSNLWNPLFAQENNYCNYCTENSCIENYHRENCLSKFITFQSIPIGPSLIVRFQPMIAKKTC